MLGTARRGYFVEGLGGAQFALAGRGRAPARPAAAPTDEYLILAATDPAQPYGAALSLAEARRGPAPGAHRRAPTSCFATATRSSTSSAAARASSAWSSSRARS